MKNVNTSHKAKNENGSRTSSSGPRIIYTQNSQMSSLIQQDINKFINNINPNFLNMVNMMDSPGNELYFALNVFGSALNDCWIIDTGAFIHMTGNVRLFDEMT